MRTYKTPIGDLWSVTTVLGACIPKPWLPVWIKKMAREAVLELIQEKPDISKWDVQAQEQAIKDAINSHELVASEALSLGSLCHNCLEVYFKEWEGLPYEYLDFLADYIPDQVITMLKGTFDKLHEEGIVVLQSEQVVWHQEGYAGTLDAVVELKDGSNAILDFKTSKQFSSDHAYQLEAYRRAWNENIDSEIEAVGRVCVRIDKDKPGYVEVKYYGPETSDEHWNVFKACLTIFKAENPPKIKKERKKK